MLAYFMKIFVLGAITIYAVGYYYLEIKGFWVAFLERAL